MRTMIAVGVAGFFGAVARYGLEGLITSRNDGPFPWGTFVVNVSGSLAIGFLFAVFIEGRVVVVPWLRTAATVGFVGAYTTFSTLTLETFRLVEDGSFALAGANALVSLAIGLVAVYVGVVLGRLI
jgi:fluoride exporter